MLATKVRTIKGNYWEKFTKYVEHKFFELQKEVWKIIRNEKNQIREFTEK